MKLDKKYSIINHIIKEKRLRGSGLTNRLVRLKKNNRFKYSKSSFKGSLQLFELFSDEQYIEADKFISDYSTDIKHLLKSGIKILKSIKVQFCMQCTFSKNVGNQILFTVSYFCCPNRIINSETILNGLISEIIQYFEMSIQNFENIGSNWVLYEIDRLDCKIGLYLPMVAGNQCEELPTELKNKKALITIKSKENDHKCLLYSILAYIADRMNVKRRKENLPLIRIQNLSAIKKFIEYLNLKRLKFPSGLIDIKHFEKDNKHLELKINLYGFESIDLFNQSVIPLYISKQKAKHTMNILKYKNHFYLIRNFDRLLSNDLGYRKFCYRCLSGFNTIIDLNKHLELCENFDARLIKMPTKKEYSFTEYNKSYNHLFVIFVDFEAILQKSNLKLTNKTKEIHKHIPSTFSMIVIKDYFEVIWKKTYTGPDCMTKFFKYLKWLANYLEGFFEYKPLEELTDEELKNFKEAKFCGICKKALNNSDKVRDHDHLTGKYRQAAHTLCNIKYQIPKKIPLICHNLKNYDSNFIIEALNRKHFFKKVSVIPQTFEKFIALIIDKIIVIDSFQFLNESLEILANNLRKSNNDFQITKTIFLEKTKNDCELNRLLFQKSVFPYEYIDSFERLDEKKLPPIDKFYSSLSNENISIEKYKLARNVWKSFNIKSLKEYQEFYCLLDTSLLADIFQTFRQKIYEIYELDCCHFFSIPGLSWAAALKYTKANLDLIQDVNAYQFIELGIRGGICGVIKREAKANNQFIESFDSEKPRTFICHLDVNK